MHSMMLVALGGALGSLMRFKLSGLLLHYALEWRFPLGTFVVNIAGCFLIGLVAGLGEKYQWLTADVRIFLITGVLGGFTTFSAFGLETFQLLKRDELMTAFSYVSLSVVLGVMLLYLGYEAVPGKN